MIMLLLKSLIGQFMFGNPLFQVNLVAFYFSTGRNKLKKCRPIYWSFNICEEVWYFVYIVAPTQLNVQVSNPFVKPWGCNQTRSPPTFWFQHNAYSLPGCIFKYTQICAKLTIFVIYKCIQAIFGDNGFYLNL